METGIRKCMNAKVQEDEARRRGVERDQMELNAWNSPPPKSDKAWETRTVRSARDWSSILEVIPPILVPSLHSLPGEVSSPAPTSTLPFGNREKDPITLSPYTHTHTHVQQKHTLAVEGASALSGMSKHRSFLESVHAAHRCSSA